MSNKRENPPARTMRLPVSLIPPLDDNEKLHLAPRSSGSRGRAADEEGAALREVGREGLPDHALEEANKANLDECGRGHEGIMHDIEKAGDDAESTREQIALLCKQATQKELRERCRAASLPQYGNKMDLARRLVATGC